MKKDSAKINSMIKEIEKNPDNLDGYDKLFTYYLSVNMLDEAIEVLDAYLKIRKGYPEGECQLGVLYFNKGDYKKAEERFMYALETDPEFKDALFNLGFLYKTCARYQEALLLFRKIIFQNAEDIDTLFNVAECCSEMGKSKDAVFFYEKVLKINPDYQEAQDGLDKIQRKEGAAKLKKEKKSLKILFVQECPCIRNYKMAKALKSAGHRVSLAYTTGKISDLYQLDDSVYYELIPITEFRQMWEISKFYDIIHCHNEPDVMTVNCLAGEGPVIHDTHDMVSLRHPDDSTLKYFEGVANRGADGRIYCTDVLIKEAYEMYGVDLNWSIVFNNYISQDDIPSRRKSKLSKKDGNIHIVYEGGISTTMPHRNFINLFSEISQKGIHLHIYPAFDVPEYERAFASNPYVHYNKPISPKDIVSEMTQFDFGIVPFIETEENIRHVNSMVPHKLFEYLAAGLPVISSDIAGMREFLNREKVGILYRTIDDIVNGIGALSKIEIKNKEYSVEDNIDKLIDFYYMLIEKSSRRVETRSFAKEDGKISKGILKEVCTRHGIMNLYN
ncbi:glycosyltransferase [candidate division KSB1 bacterium]